MSCTVCGFPIPEKAKTCPHCGAPAPTPTTHYGVSSSGPTQASSGYSAVPPTVPSYGIDPYNPAPVTSNSYSGTNNYHAATGQTPPPPIYVSPPPAPSSQRQGKRTWVIVGIVILLLLLVGEGIYLLLARNTPAGPDQQQLNATATTTAQTQATATAEQTTKNPYPPHTGTLVLSDPLRDNSKGYQWDDSTILDEQGGGKSICGFAENAYHVRRTSRGALICAPEESKLIFSNLAYEVNLTQIQGENVGLVIHLDQTKGTGYLFAIDPEGNYSISAMNLSAQEDKDVYKALRQGTNGAFKRGMNQKNLIAMIANNNTISIFINNQFVDSIQDKTYTSGQIGVYVWGENASDVAASDMRVWKL